MRYNLKDLELYRRQIPQKPGIYLFRNLYNGKCYVGQSVNLRIRLNQHFQNYRNLKDYPIYHAFQKYGLENFEYQILECYDEINRDLLDTKEKDYIENFDCYLNGYNQTKGGDKGVLGLKMTEEQKKKVSDALKKKESQKYVNTPFYCCNTTEDKIYFIESINDIGNYPFIKITRKRHVLEILNGTYRYKGPIISQVIYSWTLEDLEEKIKLCKKSGVFNLKNQGFYKKGHVSKKYNYDGISFYCCNTTEDKIYFIESINDIGNYAFIKLRKCDVLNILNGTYRYKGPIISQVIYDKDLKLLKIKIQETKDNGTFYLKNQGACKKNNETKF